MDTEATGKARRARQGLALVVASGIRIREMILRSLPGEYRIVCLSDGQEFEAAVEAYNPDFIILDARLSSDEGCRSYKQLKAKPGFLSVPVIYIAGHRKDARFFKALKANGDLCLSKPVAPGEFRKAARKIIDMVS